MRRLQQLAMLVLALAPAGWLRAGEVIDRIVVTVNGVAVLESDWDEAARFECLLEQKPLESLSPTDLKATLERLVDQTLIQQQMQSARFSLPTSDEVSKSVLDMHDQVTRNFVSQKPSLTWQQALERYGLTEEQFESRAAQQVQTLRFIDQRFRPGIRIDHGKVESYYREKVLPELQRNGAKQAPLAEVSPKIQELLVQQTMNEMLTAWLRSLRAQSEVEVR